MNEQEKQRQLAALTQVFRDVPAGFCTLDLELRFVFVNEWLAVLNGIPAAAHLGRAIHELIPDNVETVEAQLRQVIETGVPFVGGEIETDRVVFQGERRVLRRTYAPIKDDDGETVGLSCLVQDITEQRRAEQELRQAHDQLEARVEERTEALQESEDRLRLVNDALPVGIVHVGADMRYLSINKCGADWFSDLADDLVGRSVEEVHGANFEKFRPHIEKVLSGEATIYETMMTHPDGVAREVRVIDVPEIAADGSVRGYFALVENITEQNAAERRLLERLSI